MSFRNNASFKNDRSSTAIITDTDASLPRELAMQYDIRQVPINIHFGQETFKTEEEMNDVQLFARVDREGHLPTTSAPSPGQFAEAFQSAFDAGAESVICLCVSAAMSGTYNAAVTARDLFPSRDIAVIDTQQLSLGQGLMVLAAAEAAQSGASKEEIIAQAVATGERTYLYASLSTLKYLAMSGRVGHVVAGMASLLNIKPVLTLKEGKLDMLERVRTQKKSWARVIQLTQLALNGRAVERVGIIHVNDEAKAREFESQLRLSIPCPDNIILADFTAGLSVHAGPGLIGVAVVANDAS
ncbi:MAG: DegV family protein [Anaerolineae bacterium]|nr:DegV family protein [Anaerolineae bacterium]